MMENLTNGSDSLSGYPDTNKITIVDPIWGQKVANWITITETDTDGHVIYGPFTSQEYALIWAEQLINASIEPVYVPAYNRG
jgi:hypothetical protein